MHRTAVAVACVFLALVATVRPAHATPGRDAPPVVYQPPVPGPIVDDWRPPARRYGPGNRGVDFATTPGEPVGAAAPGEVVFAGPVAGSLHVVVLHPDGLRTSYSFLDAVTVRRGDHVDAGDTVGVAAGSVHFGARAGDEYLDPLTLLRGPPRVHLVADELARPGTVAQERGAIERFLRSIPHRVARAGGAAAVWARDKAAAELTDRLDELRIWVHYADAALTEYSPWVAAAQLAAVHDAWRAAQARCTPASARPPAPGAAGHLLVRVAGLGSHTGASVDARRAGAIADLDATSLGYAPSAVVQFSYAGGTTAEHAYTSADTQASIRDSARQLRLLLDRLAREHPGVPIDIVAHSQGGLVARAALAFEFDGAAPARPPVASLVTLGTPHHGADLATAARMVDAIGTADRALDIASVVRPLGLDPRSPSIRDLAETSAFIRDLGAAPLPDGVRITSIAARADLAVPAPRAHVDGATNVVVDPGGLDQHDALPGSAPAAREVALALAGAPPTCESLRDAYLDYAVPRAIASVEDSLGAGAAYLSRRAG